jgi:hypothetical protein
MEGQAPASPHTLIMPAENVEFALESPVLSVCDNSHVERGCSQHTPTSDHMIRGVATGDPKIHAAK